MRHHEPGTETDPGSAPEPNARDRLRDYAPKLIEITDQVLFDDIWRREELSPRDRSLITVTALVALGDADRLPNHLRRAIANGVEESELIELVTHLAFYVGWPRALAGGLTLQETLHGE